MGGNVKHYLMQVDLMVELNEISTTDMGGNLKHYLVQVDLMVEQLAGLQYNLIRLSFLSPIRLKHSNIHRYGIFFKTYTTHFLSMICLDNIFSASSNTVVRRY